MFILIIIVLSVIKVMRVMWCGLMVFLRNIMLMMVVKMVEVFCRMVVLLILLSCVVSMIELKEVKVVRFLKKLCIVRGLSVGWFCMCRYMMVVMGGINILLIMKNYVRKVNGLVVVWML